MALAMPLNALHPHCVDLLFAQTQGAGYIETVAPVAKAPTGPQAHAHDPNLDKVIQPPELNTPEDVQAAVDWFLQERDRLAAYTHSQFDNIRRQHEQLLDRQMRGEEALAARVQEVHREMHFLSTQAAALQQRSRELGERERLLAQQMTRYARAQEELRLIYQTSADVQKDTAAQEEILARLRDETDRLAEQESNTRTAFDAIENELAQRKQAWEEKQADITKRASAMEQRYQALEKSEEAVQRRIKELDELEHRLQRELEDQEKQAAEERRELASLRARLRPPIAGLPGARPRDGR